MELWNERLVGDSSCRLYILLLKFLCFDWIFILATPPKQKQLTKSRPWLDSQTVPAQPKFLKNVAGCAVGGESNIWRPVRFGERAGIQVIINQSIPFFLLPHLSAKKHSKKNTREQVRWDRKQDKQGRRGRRASRKWW